MPCNDEYQVPPEALKALEAADRRAAEIKQAAELKKLYNELHPDRVFIGEGDTPEEALDRAMEGMKQLDAPLESTPKKSRLTPYDPMLQLFNFEHLPPHLRYISSMFHALAHAIVSELPRNPERTACLRFLRQAKDCAVTAKLWKEVG